MLVVDSLNELALINMNGPSLMGFGAS